MVHLSIHPSFWACLHITGWGNITAHVVDFKSYCNLQACFLCQGFRHVESLVLQLILPVQSILNLLVKFRGAGVSVWSEHFKALVKNWLGPSCRCSVCQLVIWIRGFTVFELKLITVFTTGLVILYSILSIFCGILSPEIIEDSP